MTMIRLGNKTKAAALAATLIAGAEGLRQAVYLDPVGIPTQCFGETRGVKLGDAPKTTAQCQAMLLGRVEEFSAGIDKCLKVEVPAEPYAAFLSLAYNIGLGNFCGSTLVRKANAGDLAGACQEILKWDKARGLRLPGLTNRRAEENQLCMRGLNHA